jgi:hypothetical protein
VKRTRRIEIVRYTRRGTVSSEVDAPDRAEGPAADILLEALGDAAPAPAEFHPEVGASGTAALRAPFLRRLLRRPPVRGSASHSGQETKTSRRRDEQ